MEPHFLYFLGCGISALAMWYKMLGILEQNGQEVSYFLMNPKYFFDFHRLLKNEPNNETRRNYSFLLWGQIALIPIYLVGMLYLI